MTLPLAKFDRSRTVTMLPSSRQESVRRPITSLKISARSAGHHAGPSAQVASS